MLYFCFLWCQSCNQLQQHYSIQYIFFFCNSFTRFNRWTGKTRLKNRNVTLLWDYDLSQDTSLCDWILLYRHRSQWTDVKLTKCEVKGPEKSRNWSAPVVLFLCYLSWVRNGETHRCICAVGDNSWCVCHNAFFCSTDSLHCFPPKCFLQNSKQKLFFQHSIFKLKQLKYHISQQSSLVRASL